MAQLNKTEKELVTGLLSDNTSKVLETLNEIKTSGTIGIIPFLFDLVASSTDEQVAGEALRILEDIKEKAAVPVMVSALMHKDFGERTAATVAVFWQSGLNFSDHLPVFARLFVAENYLTSIEAFTVIEEFIHDAEPGIINECLSHLDSHEKSISKEKMPLFNELRKLILSYCNLSIDD